MTQNISKPQFRKRTLELTLINRQQQAPTTSSKTARTTTSQRARSTAPKDNREITQQQTLIITAMTSPKVAKERAWCTEAHRPRMKGLQRIQVQGQVRMYPVRSVYIRTFFRRFYKATGDYRGCSRRLQKRFLVSYRSQFPVQSSASHIALNSMKLNITFEVSYMWKWLFLWTYSARWCPSTPKRNIFLPRLLCVQQKEGILQVVQSEIGEISFVQSISPNGVNRHLMFFLQCAIVTAVLGCQTSVILKPLRISLFTELCCSSTTCSSAR